MRTRPGRARARRRGRRVRSPRRSGPRWAAPGRLEALPPPTCPAGRGRRRSARRSCQATTPVAPFQLAYNPGVPAGPAASRGRLCGRAVPREAERPVVLPAPREPRVEQRPRRPAAYSVKYGSVPQPTRTLPFGGAWTLPSACASCGGRWMYCADEGRAHARRMSSRSAIPRDCGSTWGSARIVEQREQPAARGRARRAARRTRVPGPIAKSLRLPPSRQMHRAGATIDLVDRPGVPGRDEQVAVAVDVDRVRVEVVEGRGDLGVGLGERRRGRGCATRTARGALGISSSCTTPLDHASAPLADARAVDRRDVVGEDERRSLRGDDELVQVGLETVPGREARDLAVRLVEDHVLADAEAVLGLPLPPGQHRPAPEQRGAEVHRRRRRRGPEPHGLAAGVDDHRTPLTRPGRRRQEEQSRRRPGGRAEHRHDRGHEIGSRDEAPHVRRRGAPGRVGAAAVAGAPAEQRRSAAPPPARAAEELRACREASSRVTQSHRCSDRRHDRTHPAIRRRLA